MKGTHHMHTPTTPCERSIAALATTSQHLKWTASLNASTPCTHSGVRPLQCCIQSAQCSYTIHPRQWGASTVQQCAVQGVCLVSPPPPSVILIPPCQRLALRHAVDTGSRMPGLCTQLPGLVKVPSLGLEIQPGACGNPSTAMHTHTCSSKACVSASAESYCQEPQTPLALRLPGPGTGATSAQVL